MVVIIDDREGAEIGVFRSEGVGGRRRRNNVVARMMVVTRMEGAMAKTN